VSAHFKFANVIGFLLDIDSLATKTEAEFRDEPRYDVKTGKLTHHERVCIKGGTERFTLDIPGVATGLEVYDDSYDFVEALNDCLDRGKIMHYGTASTDEIDYFAALNHQCDEPEFIDFGNIDVAIDCIKLSEVPQIMVELEKFKKELEALLGKSIESDAVSTLLWRVS